MPLDPKKHRSWPAKFGRAFRAIALGVRGQSSFYVHGLAAVLVIVTGDAESEEQRKNRQGPAELFHFTQHLVQHVIIYPQI